MTHDPDRDRDERGRARNAHPRDRLGRPLSRDRASVAPWARRHGTQAQRVADRRAGSTRLRLAVPGPRGALMASAGAVWQARFW